MSLQKRLCLCQPKKAHPIPNLCQKFHVGKAMIGLLFDLSLRASTKSNIFPSIVYHFDIFSHIVFTLLSLFAIDFHALRLLPLLCQKPSESTSCKENTPKAQMWDVFACFLCATFLCPFILIQSWLHSYFWIYLIGPLGAWFVLKWHQQYQTPDLTELGVVNRGPWASTGSTFYARWRISSSNVDGWKLGQMS